MYKSINTIETPVIIIIKIIIHIRRVDDSSTSSGLCGPKMYQKITNQNNKICGAAEILKENFIHLYEFPYQLLCFYRDMLS